MAENPLAALVMATRDKLTHYLDQHSLPFTAESDKLVFHHCPLKGTDHTDGGPIIYVNDDGTYHFTCFHAKCEGKTFNPSYSRNRSAEGETMG